MPLPRDSSVTGKIPESSPRNSSVLRSSGLSVCQPDSRAEGTGAQRPGHPTAGLLFVRQPPRGSLPGPGTREAPTAGAQHGSVLAGWDDSWRRFKSPDVQAIPWAAPHSLGLTQALRFLRSDWSGSSQGPPQPTAP
uniref:Uncharacterized protein n=1 Tax=Pipistrellus kuhlii TaxID=59472 RepID=A0A7J7VBY3_PIPKU|nr:hypothetical protein mPipKuh1_008528 [Pipistrellus kuhlii]